jgi:hypothetical protein
MSYPKMAPPTQATRHVMPTYHVKRPLYCAARSCFTPSAATPPPAIPAAPLREERKPVNRTPNTRDTALYRREFHPLSAPAPVFPLSVPANCNSVLPWPRNESATDGKRRPSWWQSTASWDWEMGCLGIAYISSSARCGQLRRCVGPEPRAVDPGPAAKAGRRCVHSSLASG